MILHNEYTNNILTKIFNQKLEQTNKKSVTSAQKSGKAAKAAAVDAAEVAMTTLQSEHAKQVAAWHAANAESDDADNDVENSIAAAPAVVSSQQPQGLSKAAKRRLAKERAEEEHNARVADAAANRFGGRFYNCVILG